ncbi:MAG: shikimate kinase [Candidatus Bathyarchaeota archaeon]|nr:shikimate kinase [Candidatus Bathyarchaeota archaeon]
MIGKGVAIAYGAATIINAIALGKGAALGVDLWTKAEVILTDDAKIIGGEIVSDPSEDTALIEKTVARIFRYFDVGNKFGAKIKTWSNIPIARGLKSSSAAANAVAIATLKALDKKADDLSVISFGVDAAFDAKVTITGAFDDACASYFGDVVITDNIERKLLKRAKVPENAYVLFFVPDQKVYTANVDVTKIRSAKSLVDLAFKEAMEGNHWIALSLNGFIYSSILGYKPDIALEALEAGALASGLCGTGPAVTAVVTKDNIDQVKLVFQRYEGDIIEACLNHKKATVINN